MKAWKQKIGVTFLVVFLLIGMISSVGAETLPMNLTGLNSEYLHQEYYNFEPGVSTYGETNLPSSYNLKDEGLSTGVRYQNPFSSCWSFGTLASIESNVLKQTRGDANTLDLSERQLTWFGYEATDETGVSDQGEGRIRVSGQQMNMGGNRDLAAGQLVTWNGVTTEEVIPYTNREGKWDPNPYGEIAKSDWSVDNDMLGLSDVHIQNVDYMPSPATFTTVDSTTGASSGYAYSQEATNAIKNTLLKSGAVEISYCANESSPGQTDTSSPFWNEATSSQYAYTWAQPNHSVAIVGWDDDYQAENFSEAPPENGAFIVKNSWSEKWGKEGYFYLSYYDQSIASITSYQVDLKDDEGLFDYDTNYQYDYNGLKSIFKPFSMKDPVKIANIFTAEDDEVLKAISAVTLAPQSTVTFSVYKTNDPKNPESGECLLTQAKTFDYGGFHSIDLENPITLAPGEAFSVVQEVQDAGGNYYLCVEMGTGDHTYKGFSEDSVYKNVTTVKAGESFTKEGDKWKDIKDEESATVGDMTINFGNAMIKAYTSDLASVTALKVEGLNAEKESLGAQTVEGNKINLSGDCAFAVVTPTLDAGGSAVIIVDENRYAPEDLIPVEALKGKDLRIETTTSRGDVLSQSYTVTIEPVTPQPTPTPSTSVPQNTAASIQKTNVGTGVQAQNMLPLVAILILLAAAAAGVVIYKHNKKD